MQPLVLPLESDETIRINAYRDGRGIRVVFQEGRFINIGLFRRAYHVVASGEETSSGPVTIRVLVDDDEAVTMDVRIEGAEGALNRTLPPDVCDEVIQRLLWADALLSTYDLRLNHRHQPLARAKTDVLPKPEGPPNIRIPCAGLCGP